MVRIFSVLFLLLLLIVGVSFSTLNSANVEINYYFGLIDVGLARALVLAIAVGVCLGVLGSLGTILKLKGRSIALKKNIKSLESEVSSLKVRSAKENI